MIAYEWFRTPLELGWNSLWLVLPLCAVVALVYKTVRVPHLRQLPLAVLGLWAYILVGLVALGIAMHLLLAYAS